MSVVFILASLYCLVIGVRSLRDNKNHQEYGVESSTTHKIFSWMFIISGIVLGLAAMIAS